MIKQVFIHGIRTFKNSLSLNIASMFTIVTVLFIYNLFIIMADSTDTFLKKMTGVDSIRAYTKVADKKTIDGISKKIAEIKGVSSVKFYDAENSYKYLKEVSSNIPFLDKVPKDLFPSFLEINLNDEYKDAEKAKIISDKLAEIQQIDSTGFGESWIQNFLKIRTSIHLFMVILTVLLSLSVSFIIYNTIKLSLFRYKDDIKIYSLVGATNSFITYPYIISSIIEIMLSFAVSAVSVHAMLMFLNVKLLQPIDLNILILPGIFFYLKSFGFVMLISIISSYYSVQSFLGKVGSINEG